MIPLANHPTRGKLFLVPCSEQPITRLKHAAALGTFAGQGIFPLAAARTRRRI